MATSTKTVPIRRTITPLKRSVNTNVREATDFLTQPIPTTDTELREHIFDLMLARDTLSQSICLLRKSHDQWNTMVQDLPDEQDAYESACEEIIEQLITADSVVLKLDSHLARRRDALQRMVTPIPAATTPLTNPDPTESTVFIQQAPQTSTTGQPPVLSQFPGSSLPQVNSQLSNQLPRSGGAFKAPKIKLPTFGGDYMEFKQFWGVFEANIHDRTDLTNIEKFSYLLSQLEGEAKKAIAGVMVTDDNYECAVALLKSRFDRADERMIAMLYSELARTPACGRKTSDKQHTLDTCERIFRQLMSAGEDVNSNKALTFTFLSKFPPGMVKDLQRYYQVGTNSELNEVREGIRRSIAEEELTTGMIDDLQLTKESRKDESRGCTATGNQNQFPGFQRPYSGNPRQNRPNDFGQVFHNSAMPAVTNRSKPQMLKQPSPCYFCGGSHFNGDCTQYPTAKGRIQRLKEVNRCTRCTRFHDIGTACPFDIKCVHCHTTNYHAGALCFRKYPEQQSSVQITMGQFFPNQSQTINRQDQSQVSQNPPGNTFQNTGSGGITALNTADIKPALFQTAKTTAINPATGQQCVVRLALDTMSSRSYVTESVARKLGLVGEQSEKLFVSVFGTNKSLEVPTTRVQFSVVLRDGSRQEIEANTTRVICQSNALNHDWTDEEAKILNQFRTSLADDPFDENGGLDVLIGAGLVWEFIEGSRMPTNSPTLFLIPSKFGLMLAGEAQRDPDRAEPTMLCITESPCQFPSELGLVSCESKFETAYPDIDEFWDLEKIGITDDPTENDDDKALEIFQKTVKFDDGRYQVTFPWIEEKHELLPDNYDIAYDRLRSLTKRLKANPDLLIGYRDILHLQIERGIIEEVPPSEIESENVTHYLPHHPVLKPSSNTTKIRIVYDAAAKKTRQSLSLNECMFRGPVILPDLCQMLMRIRVSETVIISDIEKAFLQVSLQPRDRDVTRFLWFKNDENLSLMDNVAVFRFTRVNFGVISSPFLLAATINHHLTLENSKFAERLRNDVYVDNVISGLSSRDDPIEYYQQIKPLFERAGMNIYEFCTNSRRLMEYLPDCDHVKQNDRDVKVLGMKWDSQNDDTLRLIPSSKLNGDVTNSTKRKVLQAVASIFDPLGFFQPILLPAKCFLQKLWKMKYDWNDPLKNDLLDEWVILKACIMRIFEHRIPRFIGEIDHHTTLAVFCDASARAYSTNVYLRCRLVNGKWRSRLIFSKSRLSPSTGKKKRSGDHITLPRLELLGAVIGVRAGNFCRNGLKIPSAKIDVFIDSQCVLHWIGSRGLLKRFVGNRVEEIRKVTNSEFHYVPTADNPADYGTRGKLPEELFSSDLWWNGPSWLEKERSEWPKSNVPVMTDTTLKEIQVEIKPVYFEHTLAATDTETMRMDFLGLDPNAFSSLRRLIRVSTICLKFLKRKLWLKLFDVTRDAKPELTTLFGKISTDAMINSDEYETAKLQWVKCVQQTHFTEIYEALRDGDAKQRPQQMILQLGLKLDPHELIRTQGRYEHADLPEPSREPLLLPKDDRFTTLVIKDVHQRTMHSGVSHTLSQVRLEFWVPHGRALVRRVLRTCLICRRFKTAKPYKLPPMPPWPRERVSRAAPFQATGLDYFGPITVKVNDTVTKMWVCLFTCLAVRAVHLEPVMDCSTQEFLHCLIRFTSRRGVPESIISDNAAQFQLVKILGDQAWKRVPTDETVTSYAAENSLKWKFITELAPWKGGFYERLVGLVKSTLRTSIRRKLLSWTDLVTLLAEAEAVVNSRPLTYVGDEVDSSFRVIRPSDFLLALPNSITDSADGAEVRAKDFSDTGKRLVSIWKQRCRTLDALWRVWYSDYLLSLRERGTVSHRAGRSDDNRKPLLNQVVLITERDIPRGQWRLARIIKLLPGNDGQIRSAELILSNGYHLRRALNHLVPLEVENEAPEEPPNEGTDETPDELDHADQHNNVHADGAMTVEPQPDAGVQPEQDGFSHADQDEDDFLGFSQEDVQRTVDALQRFEYLVTDKVRSA